MTAAEFFPMLYFGGFGLTDVDTCFVKDGHISYWFALIPIFLNIPFNLVCFVILKCSKGYHTNKALQKMVRACFSMCITWGYPIFTAGMVTTMDRKIIVMDYIAFLVGSSSGTVLAVCRLGSVEIVKRLCRLTFKSISKGVPRRSKGINTVLINDCSLNVLFQELTEGSIKDMILVFGLGLLSTSRPKEKYSYGYRKLKYKFSEDDYTSLNKYIDTSGFRLKKNGIWEYGRTYFENIRNSCNVNYECLLESFCVMANFSFLQNGNNGGRSGAFILLTFDEKFVLKIVNRQERYLLLDILPAYSKRICENPDSKIVRILGMYKERSTKHSFIIMENIIKSKGKATIFDLKGSIDDRYVDTSGDRVEGCILKDGNFLEMKKSVKITKEQRADILSTLSEDIKFFTKHNIIDYSLLIAFYDHSIDNDSRYNLKGLGGYCYSLGIIDFLQEYSLGKKLELFFKRMKGKVNTSVCSSKKYSSRFLTFISNSL